MSQIENAVTSSSKRAYRKGTPLSANERKIRSVSRKRETHKPVNVFIRNALKDKLDTLCQEYGLTQAEAIELLLERENRGE
ncbi:replication regulatory protein RepA [Cedecea sp. NFIX57]|uniref:replication regulatory protein RepA n=1 Tax=Cedecea sp. NFIX57 TaxID=1566286 RepID=UPI000A0B4940|nr:replication regulatory protein RepA [Cedecea sp. NFIX57]SMG59926.1 Replication regulatory protein RepB [Cedecea sp. NFIX57]